MQDRPALTRRYSRRAVLAGLAGLTSMLAACGTRSSTSSSPASTAAGMLQQSSTPAAPIAGARYANEDMLADADMLQADPSQASIVALMSQQDYAKGHIDGAAQIDWPDLDLRDTSTDAAIQQWQQQTLMKLSKLGLSSGDRIVAYDNDSLFACRLWWVLAYLGYQDKQVLDGGLAAWQNDGGQLTTNQVNPQSTTYSGTADPSVLAPLPDVKSSLHQSNVVLLDARSPGEYAAGHIPGAVNLQYTQNAIDGTPPFFKPQEDLLAMYREIGVTTDKLIIPYCSTGVRSAVTYFTLRLIGFQQVKLFSGSWDEWSSHLELPVEKS